MIPLPSENDSRKTQRSLRLRGEKKKPVLTAQARSDAEKTKEKPGVPGVSAVKKRNRYSPHRRGVTRETQRKTQRSLRLRGEKKKSVLTAQARSDAEKPKEKLSVLAVNALADAQAKLEKWMLAVFKSGPTCFLDLKSFRLLA